ncbi:MAG: transcriptional repressor [Rhodobacteraceae bacterium]|jgi:Fur family ferric uptake transcriptional regulator|nr:transcriptional repressor [Paracoccaceae bacterium]
MGESIIARCEAKGLRLTAPRKTIAAVIEEADDHPDVEELHARASARDAGISLATVYRTVKLFEEVGILDRVDFGDGRARYEDAEREHHDHLIDIATGEVIEFVDPELEALQERIAERLGFRLKGHRMELYGVRRDRKAARASRCRAAGPFRSATGAAAPPSRWPNGTARCRFPGACLPRADAGWSAPAWSGICAPAWPALASSRR